MMAFNIIPAPALDAFTLARDFFLTGNIRPRTPSVLFSVVPSPFPAGQQVTNDPSTSTIQVAPEISIEPNEWYEPAAVPTLVHPRFNRCPPAWSKIIANLESMAEQYEFSPSLPSSNVTTPIITPTSQVIHPTIRYSPSAWNKIVENLQDLASKSDECAPQPTKQTVPSLPDWFVMPPIRSDFYTPGPTEKRIFAPSPPPLAWPLPTVYQDVATPGPTAGCVRVPTYFGPFSCCLIPRKIAPTFAIPYQALTNDYATPPPGFEPEGSRPSQARRT